MLTPHQGGSPTPAHPRDRPFGPEPIDQRRRHNDSLLPRSLLCQWRLRKDCQCTYQRRPPSRRICFGRRHLCCTIRRSRNLACLLPNWPRRHVLLDSHVLPGSWVRHVRPHPVPRSVQTARSHGASERCAYHLIDSYLCCLLLLVVMFVKT